MLFPGHTEKVIPTQLIESAFLFALFAALLVLILRYKRGNLPMLVYLYAYSVFRFILEFFRGDDRGEFLGGLTPSQWQSVFMLLIAVLLTIYLFRFGRVPFAGKCCRRYIRVRAAGGRRGYAAADAGASPDGKGAPEVPQIPDGPGGRGAA